MSEIGVGEAARLVLRAVDAGGVPAGLVNVPLPGRMAETALTDRIATAPRHDTALTVGAASDLRALARRTCRGQRNIVYPYWELPTFPVAWARALDGFDGFWAPTTFVRDMLAAAQAGPVHLVPHPFDLPDAMPSRPRTGPLTIFTFFDFDSFITRKNPMGAIRAFLAAFPAGTEDVRLVVKARGTGAGGDRETLRAFAGADPRIEIVDRLLTRAEMTASMAAADVFLSLHRSEGVGLGCAEALAEGKIVVATDFGGTRDFITPETGFPVSFRTVPLTASDYIGWEGSHWAEPDIAHASTILRDIHDHPDAATGKAEAGFRLLAERHSFTAVGRRIAALLAA